MKTKRHGAVIGLIAAGALLLTACGSDNNAPAGGSAATGTSSTPVECGGKSKLNAEGSTAQKNAIDTFIQAYQQRCPGSDVAYNASGSGAGVKNFNGGQVDFGGSDSPLKADEVTKAAERCQGNPAWHLPLVFGPVAIGYKLEGVTDLVLNGEVTAKIFNGAVKKWNDPAIAALNSGASLPDKDIKVVYRSDESGTTDNFQLYLQAASKGAWTQGAGKQFKGGVGEGKEKSAGVAQAAGSVDGAITYVELSSAQDNKLSMARIDTGSGPVELTTETVGKAIDGATVKGSGNDIVLDLNSIYATTASGAYPLLLATYEIVCSKGYDADTAKAVKAFLTVAATDGQAGLADAGYAPVPKPFQDKLLTAIKAIA
ncbi:phosphate ABC transporter substrate-binding protein PstS [Saccharothrix coeruleofusca]|uniref:Phosphate-binding protein n=1 Tax=Saccharothrix coeruleofusca TaxID=33919 RepID=A0A918AM55_9PSEU|nr:phosphate ABC transporter substrate-binding protein PstS [Saccharothrix coeruleofusca]MBP2339630.1 phosphate transport system substrate-binding protein [Saccharothrix coeruleofusca]GGP56435.1 phosphate-binding protein PstS [Saccharothrix coeruleofusca]